MYLFNFYLTYLFAVCTVSSLEIQIKRGSGFVGYLGGYTGTMSACKDKDPRINGIKTTIRVVPDFPKPGSLIQLSIFHHFIAFVFINV